MHPQKINKDIIKFKELPSRDIKKFIIQRRAMIKVERWQQSQHDFLQHK
jgi:hypothetical protein